MYVRLSVCMFHLSWRNVPNVNILNNSPMGPQPGYFGYEHFQPGNVRNQGHVKTSKRRFDVIVMLLRLVLTGCMLC